MCQSGPKGIQEKARLSGKSNSLGTVQATEILQHKQIIYTQTRTWPEKWDTQKFLGFWDKNGSSNLVNNKNRTCRFVELAVPANPKMKSKGKELVDRYLDLARELKITIETRKEQSYQ